MKPYQFALGLAPALLLLSGCPQTVDLSTKSITEIKTLTTALGTQIGEVETGQKNLTQRQSEVDSANSLVRQNAANLIADASYVNARNIQNPYTFLTGVKLSLAAAAVGVDPVELNQRRIIEQIEYALSQSESDQATLRAQLEEERLKVEQTNTALIAAQEARGVAEKNLVTTTNKLVQVKDDLEGATDDAVLADEARKEAEAREARERAAKTRLHVAYGFMGMGGLLIVAAIVATVLHVPGVLAGGLAGGGALLVIGWLITALEDLLSQLWFRITLGAVVTAAVGIVAYLVVKALRTRTKATFDARISEGSTGAIQEVRNDDAKTGSNVYAALKPYLQEWFVDDNGNQDKTIAAEIDRRLEAMNLKIPDAAQSPVLQRLLGRRNAPIVNADAAEGKTSN